MITLGTLTSCTNTEGEAQATETISDYDLYSHNELFIYMPFYAYADTDGIVLINNEGDQTLLTTEEVEQFNVEPGKSYYAEFGRHTQTIYELTEKNIEWTDGTPYIH